MTFKRPRRKTRFRPRLELLEPRRVLAVLGDVNGDHHFDSSDLVKVFSAGEYDDGIHCNSTYEEGDWNDDCEFDSSDLVLAFQIGFYNDTVYPRLLFGPDDVPTLRDKVSLPQFSHRFEQERQVALKALDVDYSDPTLLERQKARDANRIAFVVLMLDESDPDRVKFAAKAREIMLHINDGLWGATAGLVGAHHTDWSGGELHKWYAGSNLVNYSAAYDWLVGAGELTGRDRAEARFRLLRLAQIEHSIHKTPWDQLDRSKFYPRKANYGLRSLSGVGMVALTFPNQKGLIPDPSGRLDPADQEIFDTREVLQWVTDELFVEITVESANNPTSDSMIGHYVSPDGYYEEGFFYQNDAFVLLTPFLVAYDQTMGVDYISEDGVYDGRIAKMYENNIRMMMPNGARPTNNDAIAGKAWIYHELIASYTSNPDMSFWYAEEVNRTPGLLGFTLAAYRSETDPLPEPTYRTEFQAEAGMAVFRDQWGPDATYMMLTAGHRPVFGHNQADQGSIMLYAHGTNLVIDPGYGSAYRADPDELGYVLGGRWNWVGSALAHSGVTVDSVYTLDETPAEDLRIAVHPRAFISSFSVDPDPAYLRTPLAARDVDYALADILYEEKDASLKRAVAFPRHSYFVLEDTLSANAIHQYGWQLQLGNSSKGAMTHIGDEYLWTTTNPKGEDVGLGISMLAGNRNVRVLDNGPTNLDGYIYPNHVYDHTYILADEVAQDTRFVTLLNPHALTGDGPKVETLLDGRAWKVVHSPTQYDLIISQSGETTVEVDRISTDTEFLVASVDLIDETPVLRSLLARGGTEAIANYEQEHVFTLTSQELFHYESSDDRLANPG